MHPLMRPLATFAFGASVALLLIAVLPKAPSGGDDTGNAMVAAEGEEITEEIPADLAEPPPAEDPQPESSEWHEHTVGSGEVLGKILPRYGLPTQEIWEAAKPYVDLSKLRAGKVLRIHTAPGATAPDVLEYPIDADQTLKVSLQADGTWKADLEKIEYERREGTRTFTVNRSLWEAAVGAGLRPSDIVALADVFRYDIDFNSEIRRGAKATMVVEELWTEGRLAGLGAPLAVRFENSGKEYLAIRFEGPEGPRYYDAKGQSRKGPFLRSPLKFSRVTSGFSRNRYHPILKRGRPHNGVDFGAPEGTPVYAVGDATVSWAGPNSGHGRFVKLDHAGPYDSSYSHLSRISVHKGQKIRQGQLIGYVGSTGLATGPHLHYQFWSNGKLVNPLTVPLPRGGDPIPESMRAAFEAQKESLLARLDRLVSDDALVAEVEPEAPASEPTLPEPPR